MPPRLTMIRVLVLCLCLAPACSLPQMPLDPTLRARATSLPIKRDNVFKTSDATIGGYRTHVTRVQNQDTSEWGQIGPVHLTHTTPWELALEVRGREFWASACHLDTQALPACAIAAADRPKELWLLHLEPAPHPHGFINGNDAFPLQGILRSPSGQELAVQPVWASGGHVKHWLGFTLTDTDRVVGTVQTLPDARLWVLRQAATPEPVLITTLYNLYLLFRYRRPLE